MRRPGGGYSLRKERGIGLPLSVQPRTRKAGSAGSVARLQPKKDTKLRLDNKRSVTVTLDYVGQTGNLDVELPTEVVLRHGHTSAYGFWLGIMAKVADF